MDLITDVLVYYLMIELSLPVLESVGMYGHRTMEIISVSVL